MTIDLIPPWKSEKIKDIFNMDVLKIATAGSVDDGKSTLIGRLLYDTGSLPEDRISYIKTMSKQQGMDYTDFSLATDGLLAEREQGITIDVAHIYFATGQRNYIIADTPGHEEFTRNMVTGASTSQLAIVLVDARKGVLDQTRRHLYINKLLRIDKVIIAINKMDLVNFDEEVFKTIKYTIRKEFTLGVDSIPKIEFIPISALNGDNVVLPSGMMDWYRGPTLLEALEASTCEELDKSSPTRFPVQLAIRPRTPQFRDFRGYAGRVIGNALAVGDEVTILPTQQQSRIIGIHYYDTSISRAETGSSVVLQLADDVQVNRGDMIVKANELPVITKKLDATVCWMDTNPLLARKKYIVQHHANSVLCIVEAINHVIDISMGRETKATHQLQLNDIGSITLALSKPIFSDPYALNKKNGAFILVDPVTNATAGVGIIT